MAGFDPFSGIGIKIANYLLLIPLFTFYSTAFLKISAGAYLQIIGLLLTGCVSTSAGIPNLHLVQFNGQNQISIRVGYYGILLAIVAALFVDILRHLHTTSRQRHMHTDWFCVKQYNHEQVSSGFKRCHFAERWHTWRYCFPEENFTQCYSYCRNIPVSGSRARSATNL
jgi:hypothetical protein